jgi:hypothetical protein
MKVWIISFLVLFGMVEMYQWMKGFTLPLPLFILGGALLAIASNYKKYTSGFFQAPSQSDPNRVQTPLIGELTNAPNLSCLPESSAMPAPKLTRPISFIISRRSQEQMRHDPKN